MEIYEGAVASVEGGDGGKRNMRRGQSAPAVLGANWKKISAGGRLKSLAIFVNVVLNTFYTVFGH